MKYMCLRLIPVRPYRLFDIQYTSLCLSKDGICVALQWASKALGFNSGYGKSLIPADENNVVVAVT